MHLAIYIIIAVVIGSHDQGLLLTIWRHTGEYVKFKTALKAKQDIPKKINPYAMSFASFELFF